MKKITAISTLMLAAALLMGCNKDTWPAQPDWSKIPDPSKPVDDGLLKPKEATTIIVAHRGGSAEAGVPDNSIAALKYAQSVGAYGSECDVYWTSDNNVIVAHADGSYQVNGLVPFEHTVAEIRAAGKLSNGEDVPTLSDYIAVAKDSTQCTRLVIDIKKLDSQYMDYVGQCAKRVSEIITEMGAKHFCIMLCTGANSNIMQLANSYALIADVPIAFNTGKTPAQLGTMGLGWANIAAPSMFSTAGGTGSIDPKTYVDAGLQVSVYNLDKQAGDGNAVYSETAVNYYLKNMSLFSMLCSNYPKWLIDKVESASKYYDGISSASDFQAFAAALVNDPTASHFTNNDGEVVLKTDLTLDNFAPLSKFTGIFDGGGHKVKLNYEGDGTQVAFFKEFRGTLKNLTVEGSYTLTQSKGEEVHAAGLISRAYDGVNVQNCINKASITMNLETVDKSACTVVGGIIGKAWSGATIEGCENRGDIFFKSPSYLIAGGMVGGNNADEGCITISNSKSSGKIEFQGSNKSEWHYIGGLMGKPASTNLMGSVYGLDVKGSSCSSEIVLGGVSKIRTGGIAAYAKACNHFSDDEFSGKISISATAMERNVGGICGFQETSCQGLFENCTFSGRIECADGPTKAYWVGGIISSGYNAATVIDGCKTTKDAYVANTKLGSIGMIAGYPKSALTVKNCKIAGTIVKGTETVIISESNLEDWMFKGSATTAAVVLSGNSYNK